MKEKGDLVGILLAAGRSTRFGSDKLLHPLPDGTPMALAGAKALCAALPRTVAVIRADNTALAALFAAHGIETAIAEQADAGMGASLAAGIAATAGAGGWLVALGDMPHIRQQTVGQVAGAPGGTQLPGAARTSGGVFGVVSPGTARAARRPGRARAVGATCRRAGAGRVQRPGRAHRYRRAGRAHRPLLTSPRSCETRSGSARQFLFQDVVELRRIGLALAGLHRLADEEAEQLVLPAAVFRHLAGVGGDDVVHDLFNGAGV